MEIREQIRRGKTEFVCVHFERTRVVQGLPQQQYGCKQQRFWMALLWLLRIFEEKFRSCYGWYGKRRRKYKLQRQRFVKIWRYSMLLMATPRWIPGQDGSFCVPHDLHLGILFCCQARLPPLVQRTVTVGSVSHDGFFNLCSRYFLLLS